MTAVLKFSPLPMDTESFDFVETPDSDEGWVIYGIQLNGEKPRVDISERLRNKNRMRFAIARTGTECEDCHKGRILGINQSME